MTNKEKIKLVQENKAQLVESCKNCLNCKRPKLDVTDWDVMQSGYSDEQLYPDCGSGVDKLLNALMGLYPKNIPEIEQMPIIDLKIGDECLIIWDENRGVWKVKALCADGSVDVVCEKYDAHMSLPSNELRLIGQLEVLEMHDVLCTTIVIEG